LPGAKASAPRSPTAETAKFATSATAALAIDIAVWLGASGSDATAEEVAARADEALGAVEALEPWLAYERARVGANPLGAYHALMSAEDGLIDPDSASNAWRIAWLSDATKRLRAADPILLRFDGLQLGGLRTEYAQLDASVMEMRRRVVAADQMLRQPPAGVQSPMIKKMTELALLRKCIGMAARHPAIRDVTARAGKALQTLKPCFMMGPLSVAQYLAPGALNFDLVIMDEASQIRPEAAIGAVARGGQLVVVGDDKQLPPTSFFDRVAVDEDGSDGSDGDGGFAGQNDESVLALASGAFPGEQGMLQWHYRSRHPELIAFSNHQFYDNKLIVFPAPQESDCYIGLTREFVPNGTAFDGVNDTEASLVAQAAVEHLRQRPSQSLMVVAMNIKQKERIETHINSLRATDAGLGSVLDDSEAGSRLEPFVVKNLENVQGDERDVVMISMTYGPRQPGGPVPQNFGPINQEKGHRRLNVLFSRAKERMVVFSSMRSTDIQAGLESGQGVQALQGFLRFAETKQLSSGSRLTGKPPGSPFEEAVARELDHAGYQVEPQLGVAGYYIDIAVRNPEVPQQFLLGIECDGAMYHSTLIARDRDRLRQEILENLGWEIERIWSVDWFRDSQREMQRVKKRLAQLRSTHEPEWAKQPASPEERAGSFGQGPDIPAPEPTASPGSKTEPHAAKVNDIPATPRPGSRTGLPLKRRDRSALDADNAALTREESRAALVVLRERIDVEWPEADPARGLLRRAMLDELVRKRPTDADEWRTKIPLDLRQGTDGEQFKRYAEDVFDILARAG
jgi:very-short-patch-repair endonuclease